MSRSKTPSVPVWWKNTYFWISLALFVIGIIGLPMFGGDNAIRDPGQKVEHNLYWLYFGASIVMLIGGMISHAQTVQQYKEETNAQ